jgi:predicted metal-binding transcription factor (methanogenesis marker protein 9)
MRDIQSRILSDTVFVAAYAGVMWCGWWFITHPDQIREMKMKAYKIAEQECMHKAKFWADKAEEYSKVYDSMRAVTL